MMDHLALFRFHQAQDDAGQGRFAGTALSYQSQDLSVSDHKIHVVEHFLIFLFPAEEGRLMIAAADVPDFQHQIVLAHEISFPLRVGMASISFLV